MKEIDLRPDHGAFELMKGDEVVDLGRLAMQCEIGARPTVDEVAAERGVNAVRQADPHSTKQTDQVGNRRDHDPALCDKPQRSGLRNSVAEACDGGPGLPAGSSTDVMGLPGRSQIRIEHVTRSFETR
ncbi:hypothetical protein [Bradyrhizobium sp. BWC-3-1]|uniref:hypothetical protein n=1 Tax=Bradyrhizobium sp. BWC-3-1 TaxID=3080012 RepID=UPI00293E6DD6|nr:hypothetical protein [Bradyrhizobium sp. BWC-3-1]WOH61266.1 hypothetical protein RX329_14670 [Bradyrhizobium sp. BWC-3-1]